MLIQIPDIDEAESLDAWTADVASATDVDEPVVRAIARAVEERDDAAATPWDAESSGRTYDWPTNEHNDF